jgi:hypothetical protein
VALVVVGHRGAAPLFDRQPGLGAVERPCSCQGQALDLALLVDAEDHGMRRRIAVETDHVLQLVAKLGSLEILKLRTRCGCNPCPVQIRRTEDGLIPTALAIAGAVQWVAVCVGAWLVSANTRSTVADGKGGMRDGRVLSRVMCGWPPPRKKKLQQM